ncbi:MAG TPA: response regulator [Polyangiales bacterium]|nr:response regulator [Polyangiales bacterium]
MVADGGPGVILVVEDHPTLRDTLVLALSRAGYHVHSAGTPREAIDCFHGHASEVDLLLVDCGLGCASGRELASELRLERPSLRVLYVSGAPEHLPARESIGPCEACLIKPFGSQALMMEIERLLPARAS